MSHVRCPAALKIILRSIVSICFAGSAFCAEIEPASVEKGVANLSIAVFDIDATPPIGSMMAYDPVTNKWDLGLRARGIVLQGAGDPIVLCAVDWIGIAN